jgi:hypothetical protein
MVYNVGIDYSITSPALCLGPLGKKFNWKQCKFFSLSDYDYPFSPESIDVTTQQHIPWKNNMDRFDHISDWAMNILKQHHIKKVLVEGYAFGARGQVFQIGENTGILKLKLHKGGYDVEVAPPTTIKKFATGKGTATKDMMYEAWMKETGFDLKDCYQPKRKLGSPTTDLVDAYFLCKYVSEGHQVPPPA